MASLAQKAFRVHSFTGVITGLLLFLLCWSGTFAVLAHELDWLATPAARAQPVPGPDNWAAWEAGVHAHAPDARLLGLRAPLNDHGAAQAMVALPGGERRLLFITPATGQVQGEASPFTVQRFFREFHRSFYIPTQWGTYLVAALAVTLLVSLVAGLLFYRRWWRRFFSLRLRRGPGLWSELHKFVGLWSLWFVLIIGVTGLWYGVERARLDMGDGLFAYAGPTAMAAHRIAEPDSDPSRPPLSVAALVDRARALRPALRLTTVIPGPDRFYAEGEADDLLVRPRANLIYLDARSGAPLYSQDAGDLPAYWRWSETADPLHFGDFAGLPVKLLWFVFGLLLCGLILTGTWMHARRLGRSERARQRHRWPGTGAAVVVSLVVVVASVPLAVYQVRLEYGGFPPLHSGVMAVVLGWVVLTVVLLAGWGWSLKRR